jgi:hypothetical protein
MIAKSCAVFVRAYFGRAKSVPSCLGNIREHDHSTTVPILLLVLMTLAIMPSFATTPAPIISVPAGTLTAPAQVAIAGVTGSTTVYTLDGTTPTSTSPVYTKPIQVNYSLTVNAMSMLGGTSSTVSSATYTLNATQFPPPSTDSSSININLQAPTSGIPK